MSDTDTDTAPDDPADTLTRVGAIALAARLDAYWRAQGHTTVRHWVEPARSASNNVVYVVRSNLVAGRPPHTQSLASCR